MNDTIHDKTRLDAEIKQIVRKNMVKAFKKSFNDLKELGIPIDRIEYKFDYDIIINDEKFLNSFVYKKEKQNETKIEL